MTYVDFYNSRYSAMLLKINTRFFLFNKITVGRNFSLDFWLDSLQNSFFCFAPYAVSLSFLSNKKFTFVVGVPFFLWAFFAFAFQGTVIFCNYLPFLRYLSSDGSMVLHTPLFRR